MNHFILIAITISVTVAYFYNQVYVSDYVMFEFNKIENALVTTVLQIWPKQLVNNNDAMPVCFFMT